LAHVELSFGAVEDLEQLILTHSLPSNTRLRLKKSLRVLAEFPLLGRELSGRWRETRFILGPWRWLLIVYRYEQAGDRVLVLAIQDARSNLSATSTP